MIIIWQMVPFDKILLILLRILTRVTVTGEAVSGALDPLAAFSAGLPTRHTFKTSSPPLRCLPTISLLYLTRGSYIQV